MQIDILQGIAAVPAAEWDGLSGPGPARDPFTTHRFLRALEESRSVGAGTGWEARHLILRDGARLVAAMPLYLKTHSQGEYIFDHAFADAWTREGGRYYPKLQSAVPFTPATGARMLGDPAQRPALLGALHRMMRDNRLSSAHITFCTEAEAQAGAALGWLHRVTTQYHWHDAGYGCFDGFLAALSSRRRKAIRKERATAQGFGGTIRALTGEQIEPGHWDAFWQFYQDTGSRKWGRPYLTRAFFDRIHATMRPDLLLVLAERGGRPVAGALNFIGRDRLYGRYWGCIEDHPCLHFELCYYQAIDWALAHGRAHVEAGAQGEHKVARGYTPARVHSLHAFADARFAAAVADYLTREAEAVAAEIAELETGAPFRKGCRTDAAQVEGRQTGGGAE